MPAKYQIIFFAAAKRDGKSIAAYGAAAKGNTFLNYCGLGRDDLDFVIDMSPAKQGRFLPGSLVPVVSKEVLADISFESTDFEVIIHSL